MNKAKIMVIGYGWRADFFYRIAKNLPQQVEICAGVLRTNERAKEVSEKEGVFTTSSLKEGLKTNPDFAVLCVPRSIVKDYLIDLMKHGIPILCETPPAKSTGELNELWSDCTRMQGRVQVIEQYFLQPYYSSILKIISDGYLGEVHSVMLSALHGYHAVSIYRKFLNIGFENCTIEGKSFRFPITQTNGRDGFTYDGKCTEYTRDWASIAFDNGKVGFLDFAGEQYFSQIMSRRWNIQGTKGEVNNDEIRYLNKDFVPVQQSLQRVDVGLNNNSEWAHKGIIFLDKEVYSNAFYPARLNDDEIAVAECIIKMKEYVETGVDFYSLREALQDTYISFELEKAIETSQTIKTVSQTWV